MTEDSPALPPKCDSNLQVTTTLHFLTTSTNENFEQITRPCNSDPRNLQERLKRGYKMVIKKGTNRIVLLKFLIGKLVYDQAGLSIEEYLLLFHLYYDLLEISDPIFEKKYKSDFEKLHQVLSQLSGIQVFPVICSKETGNAIMRILDKFMPSAREYFGLSGQRDLRQSYRLILNDTIIPRKPLPKRFIGVGYKDKGYRRDPAVDGTPGWKEVATYFANIEREAEELDSSSSYIQQD